MSTTCLWQNANASDERLKNNPVLNVVNPVQQAVDSGRFQELESDHDESDD